MFTTQMERLKRELLYGHKGSVLGMGFPFSNQHSPSIFATGTLGGWKEIASGTVSSGAIDISSIPARRYMLALTDLKSSGGTCPVDMRFNNDSDNDYLIREEVNGSAGTMGPRSTIQHGNKNWVSGSNNFLVDYISNFSSKKKKMIGWQCSNNANGTGSHPERSTVFATYNNTAAQINRIQYSDYSGGAGDWASGNCKILGYDPSDTHTDSFFTQLYKTTDQNGVASIDTGTISNKKYLIVFMYAKCDSGGGNNMGIQFNGDTTSGRYPFRYAIDGAADNTTSSAKIQTNVANVTSYTFNVAFILNMPSEEKLVMMPYQSEQGTSGAVAPNQWSVFGKYTETTDITSIQLRPISGNITVKYFEVWGGT